MNFSGLEKVETGYNSFDGVRRTHQLLIVHVHAGLLAVSYCLMAGSTLSLICKSRFVIKFCADLADQPGSVVVLE